MPIPQVTSSSLEISDGSANQLEEPVPKASRSKSLENIPEFTFGEFIAYTLALGSIISSIAAVIIIGGSVLKAAVILTFLLGPYSAFQHSRIVDIQALKESYKALSKEVRHLSHENTRLKTEVQNMSSTVDELEDLENTLDTIQKTETKSVQDLVTSVEKNRQTLMKMETNVRASVLQNIITVLMTSDTDNNFVLSNQETNKLLDTVRGMKGVTVNEKKFRKIVKETNGSLKGIIDIISNLLSDGSEEEPIFQYSKSTNQ
jgi:cell division protein FtsB